MSPQPTGTQFTPSSFKGASKRPRFDDEDDKSDSEHSGEAMEDSDEEEDSDLTHEDILERKKMKAARLKVMTHTRHCNEGIGKVAAQHETPKAATPLARAIHEYIRLLMGIPRKSRNQSALENAGVPKLPNPPSDEERQNWETRKQRRETFIRAAQDKAMRKYVERKGPGFKPNRKQRKTVEKDAAEMATLKTPMQPVIFTSRMSSGGRTRYAHHFGTQCEASLAMAGFPRCTFDWQASYDTPWNSAMSSIILSHWVKTYDANGARAFGILVSDNTAANREEILRRWVINKCSKFAEQNRQLELFKTDEGKKILNDHIEIVKRTTRKRLNKAKIVEARLTQAVRLFGQNSLEARMLDHPEVHSDEELVTSNGYATRQKLRLKWRSPELDTLINLLDQVHQKRQLLPREKRKAKQLVDRGVYAPESDQDKYPPKGFQLSLVSPSWYEQQEGLVIAELQLDESNRLDIRTSIEEVQDSFKSLASRAAEEAAANGSNSMVTGK
ncbi:uncharacterized protein MELLADRAFT_108967 [Melampsora larici-populina 98AG31]|uniref:Uncharacterized protein n=1 Tax=Melampsora larici-populina (strain 98AG31 / pathotype 3-4-7) TaxID=747676 RepID=F4RUW7_MELLP|nr:uncharacterized protein MELLADRAFT_108967 [Melampsora larici-populina 98AG31]EGG03766.1 hypothetical protein MELLADRAFT_108967 [Melampsora larici-populina 98AG31]